jgi:hypothetical protein
MNAFLYIDYGFFLPKFDPCFVETGKAAGQYSQGLCTFQLSWSESVFNTIYSCVFIVILTVIIFNVVQQEVVPLKRMNAQNYI